MNIVECIVTNVPLNSLLILDRQGLRCIMVILENIKMVVVIFFLFLVNYEKTVCRQTGKVVPVR